MAVLKWTHRYPRVRAALCGSLSALFLILAFPHFSGGGLWWLGILIPVPLMAVAAEPVIRPSRAGIYAAVGTLPAWLWTHQWLWGVTKVGTPFMLVYLMLYVWLFVWAGARIHRRYGRAWITLPVVWVGVEFLRGSVALTGYPWYLSSQPLIDSPGQVLAGPAAFGGVYLVGLFAAVLGWRLWELVRFDRVVGRVLSIAGLLGVWIAIGVTGLAGEDDSRVVSVGIVQLNVPQDNRMDWTDRQRYFDWLVLRELTIASALDPDLPPDFIVWPEGFVPGWTFDPISLEHEREYGFTWDLTPRYVGDAPGYLGKATLIPATTIVDELLVMQESLGVPMIVGSVAFENLKIERDDDEWVLYTNDGMYNSAFTVADGEIGSEWYNKMHLTPFGEVMPVISNWEWLEQMLLGLGATGMEFVLSAGDEPVVLEMDIGNGETIRAGTPICFEATVAGVCRDLVFEDGERRADILVNMTNDGWFGGWEPARRTHVLLSRWRCVELGTPMIRSANTGISCVIDRRGGVVEDRLSRVDPEDPRRGYLNAEVGIGVGGPKAISGWFGGVLGWGMLGLTGIGLIMSFVQKRSEPSPKTDV